MISLAVLECVFVFRVVGIAWGKDTNNGGLEGGTIYISRRKYTMQKRTLPMMGGMIPMPWLYAVEHLVCAGTFILLVV